MGDKRNSQVTPLSRVLDSRLALVELLLAAVVIGLGISFAASGLVGLLGLTAPAQLAVAAVLVILGLVVSVWRVLARRNQLTTLEGVFFYDAGDSHRPIAVPGYDFATELARCLGYAFDENSALEAQWSGGAPGSRMFIKGFGAGDSADQAKSARLIEEATEYYVLERLSTRLTDYFNHIATGDGETIELTRDQVPEVLLQNRLLALFSTPIEDRPAFSKEHAAPGSSGGTVVWSAVGGAMFSHFDLVLPSHSSVSRRSDGAIEISTPRLRITLAVDYKGFSGLTPASFEELYLGRSGDEIDVRTVDVQVGVFIKPLGLLQGNWSYYGWIDSFIDELASDMSLEDFLDRVAWPTVAALMRCNELGQTSAVAANKGIERTASAQN